MHPKATEALDRMEESDAVWIGHAVKAVKDIAVRRGRGWTMTSDDVWELLRRRGVGSPKEPRAMGAAFRKCVGIIEATSETQPSKRDCSHGRPIRRWRIL